MDIMIDIDGTISHAPEFFANLTAAWRNLGKIHIVTARDVCLRQETLQELADWGITYHYLAFTDNKARYVAKQHIQVVFEDTDEQFLKMPRSVTVFKIREEFNFDWQVGKWVYSERTGRRLS